MKVTRMLARHPGRQDSLGEWSTSSGKLASHKDTSVEIPRATLTQTDGAVEDILGSYIV